MWLLFGRSPAVALVVLFALITVLSQLTTTAAETNDEKYCREKFVEGGRGVHDFEDTKREHIREICVKTYKALDDGKLLFTFAHKAYGQTTYLMSMKGLHSFRFGRIIPNSSIPGDSIVEPLASPLSIALVSGEEVVMTFVEEGGSLYKFALLETKESVFEFAKIVKVDVQEKDDFIAIFDAFLLLDGSDISVDLKVALQKAVDNAQVTNSSMTKGIEVQDMV
eukprot:GHVS01005618.1.p1 GENE.GHVS01005618.1~~GHVS01005618.1.p1  ORF type:complete len:223 (+),score=24.00 GHVS01005618.1:74-742(+)